jgi:hypothetical protein
VVLHDEGRVRDVPQQVEEDETTSTACSPRSGLGGGAALMLQHSGEGGVAPMAQRAAQRGCLEYKCSV